MDKPEQKPKVVKSNQLSDSDQLIEKLREECHDKAATNAAAAGAPPPPLLESAGLAYNNDDFLNGPDGRIVRIVSEYSEPLARFRRELIQDTVVFFGSARFRAMDEVCEQVELLANTGSVAPAPEAQQPASEEELKEKSVSDLKRKRAAAAVEMAHYYEDARRLAFLLTQWTKGIRSRRHRFVVTSGGGPGIMEAANRGAYEAGGKTIGLNIKLPFEQLPNRYITPDLNFEFHYFFMRKYWFAYLSKALVVFPGGWGTMDEMFELLTLAQTHKLAKPMVIVVYGRKYWESVVNMQTFVDKGAISPDDLDLIQWADTPEEAMTILKAGLVQHLQGWQLEFDEHSGEAQRGEADELPSAERPEDYFGPEIKRTQV
jgi:uncharacterized protein (TIGR00730 family)